MPKLGVQNIERVYLPSTASEPNEADKAWCDINVTITVGDVADSDTVDGYINKTTLVLSHLVTAWNLTNADNDTVADITIDNLKKLPANDFKFLSEYVETKVGSETQGLDTSLKEI